MLPLVKDGVYRTRNGRTVELLSYGRDCGLFGRFIGLNPLPGKLPRGQFLWSSKGLGPRKYYGAWDLIERVEPEAD